MIEKKNTATKHEAKCKFCNTEFFYTDDDVDILNNNYYGFLCPECNREIIVSERIPFSFPDSFFRYGNSKVLTDKETQEFINIVKKNLMKDEDSYSYSFAGTGDTMVFGTKEDSIYYDIYVAKNYWHDSWSVED